MIWVYYESLVSPLILLVRKQERQIIFDIKSPNFMINITITFIDHMNITSLASIVLVLALSMDGVDAGRTQRRVNLLRRFHKTKMQIKEAIEQSPMDARMMPRSRNIENVQINSIKNIGSLNMRRLQRDEKFTKLRPQLKALFKQREISRNKLFYWYFW